MHNRKVVIFGGGLTGLSAGCGLSTTGYRPVVYEAAQQVGGLSRTLRHGEFLYDIGGHRFFTNNAEVRGFVHNLMGDELLSVARKSQIYMRERFFEYPLKPLNSITGLGLVTTLRILADYGYVKAKSSFMPKEPVSLKDWVVSNFGTTMFELYFKEYSEKVWGIDTERISQAWVARRISGLNLSTAVKNAFFKFSGRDIPTLADRFEYPKKGIGRLSERLMDMVVENGEVSTSSTVEAVRHRDGRVSSIEVRNCARTYEEKADAYISTIPLTHLVRSFRPEAPPDVLAAADSLGFRDLIIVALCVDRPTVTEQSWVYIPEKKYPFGRFHEPKSWSAEMAPPEKTLLVVEFFAFRGDKLWESSDGELSRMSVSGLEELGFLKESEVLDTLVHRIPNAYPLFEVGYEEKVGVIYDYLRGFENLVTAGRSGEFRYLNMDHSIQDGLRAAREVVSGSLADKEAPQS